jgi:flagellar export protein FliJ
MDAGIDSLNTVREHQRRLRDQAQRALQQAERQMTQTAAQGHTLKSYRMETATRWTTPRGRTTDPVSLSTARNFLARLDGAMAQQTFSMEQLQTLVIRRRAEWLAAETRLAAMDKLIGRRQRAALLLLNRREQFSSDEHGQRSRPTAYPAQPTPTEHGPAHSAPPLEPPSCPQ